jgi:hypothetical protein
LADGGTGASLTDPNADRLIFWDDSAGAVDWLTLGTNLSITGTTLNATGGGGGSGDVVGPGSATDNAIARFDTTTGKLIQNSAATVDDNGLITAAVSTGNGLRVTSSQGVGSGTDNLVYIEATNSSWDRPIVRIIDSNTGGASANIRIDSPNPDIEFVETDQTTPAGKFEIAVNGDVFQINGRNVGDSSFEQIASFRRYANGGTLGIGVLSDVPNAMIEIVKVSGKDHFMCSTAVAAPSGNIFKIAEAGDVTINDQGASIDVRIEGDTDANLLVTDGSADMVGIGTATPLQKLHVKGRAQFGLASNTSGTIDMANSAAAGLTRLSPGAPGSDVTQTFQAVTGTVYCSGGTDVPVADGGTGVSTLTGIVKGNGTSAFSAATTGTDYLSPTVTVSSAASLTLATTTTHYVYTGSGNTTWNLPAISTCVGARFACRHRGTGGTITIDPSGAEEVYVGSNFSQWFLGVGASAEFVNDGTYWVMVTPNAFLDSTFVLQDNNDVTKQMQFQLSGITTGNTRTITVPNASTTMVGTDVSQNLTLKTLTLPTITGYVESVVSIGTVTSTSTLSLTNGTLQTATLTASTACTFTMPTATAGTSFTLLLKQAAATGNGTATFTGVKWGTAGAPTMTATAGKMDIFSFVADGTNWYGSVTQGYTY